MIRFTFRSLTAFAVAALLCSSTPAYAGCYNNAKPSGFAWNTTDPHVFSIWVFDQDNIYVRWIRVFYRAGRHSRSVYYNANGLHTLPSGTSDIFAANVNTCGALSGTDTWLRTVTIP